MNVPQIQNLHSQSFNSEFVEFVWRFDIEETDLKKLSESLQKVLKYHQLICHINKDGSIYMESNIFKNDDTTGFGPWMFYGKKEHLTDAIHWGNSNHQLTFIPPKEYKYFSNGKDLVTLVREVVEYLK